MTRIPLRKERQAQGAEAARLNTKLSKEETT